MALSLYLKLDPELFLEQSVEKTAHQAVIRRCAAIENAHPPQADCAFQNTARLG
jgi:hypothetical protein